MVAPCNRIRAYHRKFFLHLTLVVTYAGCRYHESGAHIYRTTLQTRPSVAVSLQSRGLRLRNNRRSCARQTTRHPSQRPRNVERMPLKLRRPGLDRAPIRRASEQQTATPGSGSRASRSAPATEVFWPRQITSASVESSLNTGCGGSAWLCAHSILLTTSRTAAAPSLPPISTCSNPHTHASSSPSPTNSTLSAPMLILALAFDRSCTTGQSDRRSWIASQWRYRG